MRWFGVGVLVFLAAGIPFLGAGETATASSSQEKGGLEDLLRQYQFFNYKNLDGWEGLIEQYWSVKDGALVGHSDKAIPHNTFLCSKRKYGDFELSFEVQMVDQNGQSAVMTRNSGVQVRSEVFKPRTFEVRGPQCDIGQQYWGCLYGEHFSADGGPREGMMQAASPQVIAQALKKEGFNAYLIRCQGKRVTIRINGQTTVDREFAHIPDSGIIAWQLHSGGPMTVTFRNIRFKELGK